MEIVANGTTLYAERAGSGPSVVFVHGMCGDARVWAGQVERLHDRFLCTTYDRRGHTRSPEASGPDSVERHANDLAALITELGLAPTFVVGSSGGARITLDLLRRHPSLVRGAVLSEPPVPNLAPDLFPTLLAEVGPAVQAAAEEHGPRAAVDAFFAAVCPGLWSRVDETIKDRYRDNSRMLFADLEMPVYDIDLSDIARIKVPSLVVGGAISHAALRECARRLAVTLPDARHLELDCGHVTYAEQPDEFARAVATFVGEMVDAPQRVGGGLAHD